MRKNTARHWLHAALDLLPVLLIPVFMIYSHRHTLTEQTTVDIQYKYQTNEVNNINDLVVGNIYHFNIEQTNTFNERLFFSEIYNLTIYSATGTYTNSGQALTETPYYNFQFDTLWYYSTTNYAIGYNDALVNFDFVYSSLSNNDVRILPYISISNYIPIESVDVEDTNSSVMNVFMDNFNNAVDKYFNMGNVFNMTNVYQWFNTNIFGGNAPVVIYSVWNIVLYEFVMDLLFLLYGLFMWFIDMCKRLMEKPLDSIK